MLTTKEVASVSVMVPPVTLFRLTVKARVPAAALIVAFWLVLASDRVVRVSTGAVPPIVTAPVLPDTDTELIVSAVVVEVPESSTATVVGVPVTTTLVRFDLPVTATAAPVA